MSILKRSGRLFHTISRTLKRLASTLKGTYDVLILDEVHYLKTIDSSARAFVFVSEEKIRCSRRPGLKCRTLSGTPLPNRPREAYASGPAALNFDSIDFMSEDRFSRFNPSVTRDGLRADGSPYIYVDERTGRHAELQNRLRANFMKVRHLKRDVIPN